MTDRRSDSDLVGAALEGSHQAFGELVARYKDAVFGVAFHRLGHFEEARDAAQDTFVKAFQNLPRLKQRSSFANWLYRLADGTALDAVRRSQRHTPLSCDLHTMPAEGPPEPSLLARQIRECLAGFPKPTRVAVILHYVNGYSHAEVARFLGTTPGAVKTRVSRAKSRLREEMAGMVEDGLKQERPTLRCEYAHPRQPNTVFSLTTDMAEGELRTGLLRRGFRIKRVRILSERELRAEERKRHDWEAKLIRSALTRAVESEAKALRFALLPSQRWLGVHHLTGGKWVSAARLATSGGPGLDILDNWTGRRLWQGVRQRLAAMAGLVLDRGRRRQTGLLRLRLGRRRQHFSVVFNRKSVRIDLAVGS